jgi:hypothetical protein
MFEEAPGQPDIVQMALSILAEEMKLWAERAPHLRTEKSSDQPNKDEL